MKVPYQIGVIGNIGAGKSTATKLLAERIGGVPVFEPVLDNPYLDDFYRDMKEYAFKLQVYFLSHRLRNACMGSKDNADQPFIWVDRTVYEDRDIFARNLHEMGILEDREWDTYNHIFETMEPHFERPDLFIYLKSDVFTLMRNIQRRDRDCERSIDVEYIKRLNTHYENLAHRLRSEGSTVVTVRMDNLDISYPEYANRFVDIVKKYIPVGLAPAIG